MNSDFGCDDFRLRNSEDVRLFEPERYNHSNLALLMQNESNRYRERTRK